MNASLRGGSLGVLGLGLLFLMGCGNISVGPSDTSSSGKDEEDPNAVVDETAVAGANQNDRSLGKDGDDLQTGAMVVSPSGRYIVMQRNTVTLIHDVATATYHEVATPYLRVAFAKQSDTVYAFTANGALQAVDLATRQARWSIPAAGVSLLRISEGDDALLVGEPSALRVVDAQTGAVRSTTPTAGPTTYAAFVPGQARALVVGRTVWRDKGPHTPVLDIDLRATANGDVTSIDVPNCESPIVVLPNASRAFLSPTYCSPGAQAVPGEVWTNPDPVSVIELGSASSIRFNKNLPGFGPVALSKDGSRLIAYLDVKRMDPAMFDDPKQVPWKDGQRYHLMTIDPSALTFKLAPIGNAIPRFALTSDGRGLLVDASAKFTSRTVLAAKAEVTLDQNGLNATVETNIDVFGSASKFGFFDLGTQSFSAFSGPMAPLDRFVQFADGRFVLTLGKRADGLGGVPYLIDLSTKSTVQLQGNYGSGVRDVGLSADGLTAHLRLRLPANVHDGGFYSREGLCSSSNGVCGVTLSASYEASVAFALVPPPPPPYEPPPPTPADECPGGHDCY